MIEKKEILPSFFSFSGEPHAKEVRITFFMSSIFIEGEI